MKPSISGLVLAAALTPAALTGCECHPTFKADVKYKVTITESLPVLPDPDWPPCSMPPSLKAGDSFELVGETENGEGPWCGGDGDLMVETERPAWFATELLSTCRGDVCTGTTATGCRPDAGIHAYHDGARWTFAINWQSTCGNPIRCVERYAATYTELGAP